MNFPDLPHFRQLQKDLWQWPRSRAAVMVGAGFSLNAEPLAGAHSRFPNWRELAFAMFEKLPHRNSDSKESLEKRFNSTSPLRIASEYEAEFGPNRLEQLIREQIPDRDYQPGELHRLLLELPWADIFTTNYDTLLERTEVNGRTYQPITKPSELTTAYTPRIIKLHGTLPLGPFIVQDEDYRTYPRKFASFVNCVQQALLENSFVLLGFSGDDPNFLEWTGWIRDELGEQHAPIYLVGAYSFGNMDRTLLRRRGVTPIDLAPIVGTNPPGGIHATAVEWFLHNLLIGRPFRHEDWPALSRNLPRPTRGLSVVVNRDLDPPVSVHRSPVGRITDDEVKKIMRRWSFERKEYPGWIVAPRQKRSELWEWTKHWYVVLVFAVKTWSAVDRILVLREIHWRFETIMMPFTGDVIGEFQKTVDEIFETAIDKNLRITQEVADAWFEIAFGLERDARESYDADLWDVLNKQIAAVNDNYRTNADLMHYQSALWAMWRLDLPAARQVVPMWQPSPLSPLANMRKASLLAELGDLDEARTILRSALSEVRRSLRVRAESVELHSLEGWCMYLLTYVEAALNLENHQEVVREFQERWLDLKLWNCDPWEYKEFFESVLSQPPPQPAKMTELICGFDPGVTTTSRSFSQDVLTPLLPAFACIRLYEQIGLPMCISRININSDILANACKWIAPYLGFSSPAVYIRARRADFLTHRVQAALMDPSLGLRLHSWCLQALSRELTFLPTSIPRGSTEESLLKVLAEVLSKLAFKIDESELKRTFPIILRFHQHPGVRLHPGLHDACAPWFERLFLAAEATLLFEWLPALMRAPLPDKALEPGTPVDQWSPDVMQSFPEARLRGLTISCEARQTIQEATDWLLSRTKSESDNGRWSAILRLVKVQTAELMSPVQQQQLGKLLWDRVNAVGLPDLYGFLPSAFLELPCPPEIDVRQIIKQYILSMPPGNIVNHRPDGGLFMTIGGEEAAFIHVASIVSRPVFAFKGANLSTVEWTPEETKQLYLKARNWWASDKEAFHADMSQMFGSVDSVRAVAKKLGLFLSLIVLPQMQLSSEGEWQEIFAWLAELRSVHVFPTLCLPYILLHRPTESVLVEKTLAEDISSANQDAISAAAEGIRHWVGLSNAREIPRISGDLITSLVERVALRSKPGTTSCLLQLTLLMIESPLTLTLSHGALLAAALVPWHEAIVARDQEDGCGEFDHHELPVLRVCVGRLASALRTWYATTCPGVSEPSSISAWERWCASDVLPEVRRSFKDL